MESYLLAAVIISGIALLVNAFASLGIYRSVRKLQQDVAPLIPEVKATLLQAQSTLADTARDVREVTDRAREVLHSAQAQLDYFDQAKGEMITHLKVQSERAGVGPRRRSPRVQEVVGHPWHGSAAGQGSQRHRVRRQGGRADFSAGRRPTVERATHDDEMFI